MCAQFCAIPPLAKVEALFAAATATQLNSGATWPEWHPLTAEQLEQFRPYIRPSHQRLLNSTINGENATPCAFLRQLLRPHGYKIESAARHWTLRMNGDEPVEHAVRRDRLITIAWE
jgi:hypothetical protein